MNKISLAIGFIAGVIATLSSLLIATIVKVLKLEDKISKNDQ